MVEKKKAKLKTKKTSKTKKTKAKGTKKKSRKKKEEDSVEDSGIVVIEDDFNAPVVDLVRKIHELDIYKIILFSGRDSVCRKDTIKWLSTFDIEYDELHMRPEGNNEKDTIIKRRMFEQHIHGKYYVNLILDDRNSVVQMWRDMGLTCLQVADGDF